MLVDAYFTDLQAAHVANGFGHVAGKCPGYCPVLEAQHERDKSFVGLRECACRWLMIAMPTTTEDIMEFEKLVVNAVLHGAAAGEVGRRVARTGAVDR